MLPLGIVVGGDLSLEGSKDLVHGLLREGGSSSKNPDIGGVSNEEVSALPDHYVVLVISVENGVVLLSLGVDLVKLHAN